MLTIDSAKVQALMLNHGVGVTELAELARISPKTISLLHRKDKTVFLPTLSRLAKVAKALQVEPLSLVKAVA